MIVTLDMHKKEYVHTLLLTAFICPRPPGMEALHEDDDPAHNFYHNLRWGTRSQNLHDAVRNGKKRVGEQFKLSKLTESAVRFIRANPQVAINSLCAQFGVCRETIRKVRIGEHWRHVE